MFLAILPGYLARIKFYARQEQAELCLAPFVFVNVHTVLAAAVSRIPNFRKNLRLAVKVP
jgi:hypothetical protein